MEVWLDVELSGERLCIDVDPDLTWGGLLQQVGEATGFNERDVSLHIEGAEEPLVYAEDETLADCLVDHGVTLSVRVCNKRILNAVETAKLKLRACPQWARYDREIVIASIKAHGRDREVFHLAGEELRGSLEIVTLAVKANGRALEFASEDLRAEFDVVLTAVRQHGCALQYAAPYLQAMEFIVLAAVRTHGCAFRHASPDLRADREVVLQAVACNGLALQYASPELRRDVQVARTAVADKTSAKQYADVSPELLWGGFSPGSQLPMQPA